MPPERPPRQRPTRDETRERVLDAAVALFYELGPTAATMQAIAERAGLTKGAIYSSFGTKDELFAAVVERLPTVLLTDVIPADAESRDDVERALRRFGELLVSAPPPPDASLSVLHELYALALRNPTTRETIATWVSGMVGIAAEAEPANPRLRFRVPYRDVWVLGQVLLEGLLIRRAINPELVSDELIVHAIALVAGLVEEG